MDPLVRIEVSRARKWNGYLYMKDHVRRLSVFKIFLATDKELVWHSLTLIDIYKDTK